MMPNDEYSYLEFGTEYDTPGAVPRDRLLRLLATYSVNLRKSIKTYERAKRLERLLFNGIALLVGLVIVVVVFAFSSVSPTLLLPGIGVTSILGGMVGEILFAFRWRIVRERHDGELDALALPASALATYAMLQSEDTPDKLESYEILINLHPLLEHVRTAFRMTNNPLIGNHVDMFRNYDRAKSASGLTLQKKPRRRRAGQG